MICCSFSLFNIILGDFDFVELQMADGLFGPAFFILYIFFMFFIVMNLFLAIINENYLIVKDEALRELRAQYTLVDYVKQVLIQVLPFPVLFFFKSAYLS